MTTLFTNNKLNCTLLFFIPSVLFVSWANVYLANDNYNLDNYLITFILPALLFAYSGSLIAGEIMAKRIKLTFGKILPAVIITCILSYLLLNFILIFFGIEFGSGTIFLTPQIPVTNTFANLQFSPCIKENILGNGWECQLALDPFKTARQFYIPHLLFTITALIISYKRFGGNFTVGQKTKHKK